MILMGGAAIQACGTSKPGGEIGRRKGLKISEPRGYTGKHLDCYGLLSTNTGAYFSQLHGVRSIAA